MATPVPTYDPQLLAAQAASGQAGVQAYEQAKQNLTAMKQSAVEQAMAQAQQRGAPDGAMAALTAQMSSPYDERIADVTQQGANYSAAMSARDRRMADYNASVQQARGLIEAQTAQAVAPINSEANFRVRLAAQEGQNAVDRINAQLRLDQARADAAMQAALARAGGGGGGGRGGGGGGGGGGSKKLGTPNQTELARMLRDKGGQKLQAAAQNAAQAIRTTREGNRQAGSYTAAAVNAAKRQAAAKDRAMPKNIAQNEWNRQAASYTYQAIQAWNRQQALRTPGTQANYGATLAQNFQRGMGVPVTPNQQNAGRGLLQQQLDRLRDTVTRSVANQQLARVVNRYQSRAGTSTPNMNALRSQLGGTLDATAIGRQHMSNDLLTPAQLAWYANSPDASLYEAMGLTPGADQVRSFDDLYQRSLGQEYSVPGGPGGSTLLSRDPRSIDAMKRAMELAAADLIGQGYNIDEPGLAAALGADDVYGKSWTDMQREAYGDPTMEQTQKQQWALEDRDYELAQRDYRLGVQAATADRQATADSRAYERDLADQDTRDFEDRTGVSVGQVPGDPYLLSQVAQTPEYAQAEQILFNEDTMPTNGDEVRSLLQDKIKGFAPESDLTHRAILNILTALAAQYA